MKRKTAVNKEVNNTYTRPRIFSVLVERVGKCRSGEMLPHPETTSRESVPISQDRDSGSTISIPFDSACFLR